MNIDISKLEVVHNPSDEQFEVDLGKDKATLIYMIKVGLFIILNIEVPVAFEGRGIAAKITQVALDYAQIKGYKIRSYCSYTTRYIERHPEYREIVG